MSSIGPPTGMRDWLPPDALLRQHLIETISKVYRLYGYLPIDTPAMEDLSVLLGKGGGENEKLLFKVLKRGEKLEEARAGGDLADYGLRFDLTVPLARFIATHQGKLPRVFRRYHIGPVWRADRPQKGRFREFYQCDIDVVNGASPAYEVEIITATERVLKELNLGKWWFRISDKRLLPSLLKGFRIPEQKIKPILILLDKLEKVSPAQFDSELNEILDKGTDAWGKVWGLIKIPDINKDHEALRQTGTGYAHYEEKIFKQVEDRAIREEIRAIRDNLDGVIKAVREINKESRLIFHPTLVRGMDYYTGPVYEAVVEGFPSAILGGGRYDDLIGTFAGKKIPAVGCSLGFERILSILQARKEGPPTTALSRVLLVNDGQPVDLLQRQAEQLRAAGFCVETYLDQDDLGRQFKYAEATDIPWAIRRFDPITSMVTVRDLSKRADLTMELDAFWSLLNSSV